MRARVEASPALGMGTVFRDGEGRRGTLRGRWGRRVSGGVAGVLGDVVRGWVKKQEEFGNWVVKSYKREGISVLFYLKS